MFKNSKSVAELRDLNINDLNLKVYFICISVFYLINKLLIISFFLLIISLSLFLINFIVVDLINCQLYCRKKIIL